MLDKLTKESFEKHLNETFQLIYQPSQVIEMALIEVEGKGVRPAPKHRWGIPKMRREPFSLVFRGPHAPFLRQKMYPLANEKIGELGNIFLVPITRDEDGFYYEAVFN